MQEVVVKYHGDISNIGLQTDILNQSYAILTFKDDDVDVGARLRKSIEIEYYEMSKRLSLSGISTDSFPHEYGKKNGEALDYKGKGIIIAFIDSGIDYKHEEFLAEDGTSRILYIWDQTIEGSPPKGFTYGAEYSPNDISSGSSPHIDEIGHGTAAAGIAAGKGGIAPESNIIAVKLGEKGNPRFAKSTDIMRAIKYVYEKAESLGMPLVLNINYGTNHGAHAGCTLLEGYINDMMEIWKSAIVIPCGNETLARHHFQYTIRQDETIDVHFTVSAGLRSFIMSVWCNFVDGMSFEIICPGGYSSGAIRHDFIPRIIHMCSSRVRMTYYRPTSFTQNNEILYTFEAGDHPEISQGQWTLKVKGVNIADGRFDIWLPTTEEVTDKTAFLTPSAETTLTIPSCTANVITVGGYDGLTGSVAAFSGKGYAWRNVAVKPDVIAPGVNVKSSAAGGGYMAFTGTSMAAPFVSGCAALMMEWGIILGYDPFMYGQRVKAFIRKGAKREPGIYPSNSVGYGHLDINNTLKYLKDYAYAAE